MGRAGRSFSEASKVPKRTAVLPKFPEESQHVGHGLWVLWRSRLQPLQPCRERLPRLGLLRPPQRSSAGHGPHGLSRSLVASACPARGASEKRQQLAAALRLSEKKCAQILVLRYMRMVRNLTQLPFVFSYEIFMQNARFLKNQHNAPLACAQDSGTPPRIASADSSLHDA